MDTNHKAYCLDGGSVKVSIKVANRLRFEDVAPSHQCKANNIAHIRFFGWLLSWICWF